MNNNENTGMDESMENERRWVAHLFWEGGGVAGYDFGDGTPDDYGDLLDGQEVCLGMRYSEFSWLFSERKEHIRSHDHFQPREVMEIVSEDGSVHVLVCFGTLVHKGADDVALEESSNQARNSRYN